MNSDCRQKISSLVVVLMSLFLAAEGVEITPLNESLRSRGFEVIKENNGVTAYKHPGSKIIRIAAEGVFNAPPYIVRNVIIDYRAQVNRVGRLSEARIIERGKNWMLVYQRLNLPVISDRDFNVHVTWGKNGTDLWVIYRAVADQGEKIKNGVVRVTNHNGSWQFRPLARGQKTFVRFQASIDLSGSLPLWLARASAGKELPLLFFEFGQIVAARSDGGFQHVS